MRRRVSQTGGSIIECEDLTTQMSVDRLCVLARPTSDWIAHVTAHPIANYLVNHDRDYAEPAERRRLFGTQRKSQLRSQQRERRQQ
jgi:hypothetical protein